MKSIRSTKSQATVGLLIEYHIYIFVKIQNAIFKTNLDLASILSKQPKVGLNGDQLLHLGWRQAGPLRSHSVPSQVPRLP